MTAHTVVHVLELAGTSRSVVHVLTIDYDSNIANLQREELNIRAAADKLCGELCTLPPLRSIFMTMGETFEDTIGIEKALQVTENSSSGIFHQVFCTSHGYAAASHTDRDCIEYTVASYSEVHGEKCNGDCLNGGSLFVGNCRIPCKNGVAIMYR
jgi:hypothetical protein